jgi:hypothetical protein
MVTSPILICFICFPEDVGGHGNGSSLPIQAALKGLTISPRMLTGADEVTK